MRNDLYLQTKSSCGFSRCGLALLGMKGFNLDHKDHKENLPQLGDQQDMAVVRAGVCTLAYPRAGFVLVLRKLQLDAQINTAWFCFKQTWLYIVQGLSIRVYECPCNLEHSFSSDWLQPLL